MRITEELRIYLIKNLFLTAVVFGMLTVTGLSQSRSGLAEPARKGFVSSRTARSVERTAVGNTLSGHIAHENGVFLSGVTVSLTGINRTTVTDNNGYYFFDDVPSANFTLQPSKAGYQFYPPGVSYQGYVSSDVRNFSSSGPPPTPPAPAPGTPQAAWTNYYQNPVGGEVSDYTSMIARDANGNVYYAGSSMHQAANGATDFVLIKTDPNGNRLWVRRFDSGSNGNDNLHDILLDAQGNVYLGGESYRGLDLDFDYTVVKYDPSGNQVWFRHFDGQGSDELTSMDLDPSGNVLVTGQSLRVGTTFDYVTLKYDPQGNVVWQARFDGGEGDGAREVETDSSGNVYVTGTSSVTSGGATTDIVTIKYNSAGQQQWLNRYDSHVPQGDERAHELEVDCQGNVYVMGNVDPNYVEDNIVIKINSSGATQWVKIWNASNEAANDLSSQIAVDCSGNIYVTGITNVGNEINNNDAYLVKLNPANGEFIWSKIYDEPFSDDYQGDCQLLLDPAGNVYLGTTSQHFFNYNLVIMKFSPSGEQLWKYKYDNPYFNYDAFADWRSDGSFPEMVMDTAGNIYFSGESTIPGQAFDLLTGKIVQAAQARAVDFDFDADGKADIAVYRPQTGEWYIQRSSDGGYQITRWGLANDKLVPGDFDGDMKADLGVYRDGIWYVLRSSDGGASIDQFGIASDRPVTKDFDNDGRSDLSVFRDGLWYNLRSSNGTVDVRFFGTSGDAPTPGDYDGNGSKEVAVFRAGTWYTQYQTDLPMNAVQFGLSSDVVVPADYDGDARTDYAVFRSGVWYVWQSSVGGYMKAIQWGMAGDIPVAADYDGDRRADFAVYRQGIWHILQSSNNEYRALQFGVATDIPVPAAGR